MTTRILLVSLLATSAFTTVSLAQTAQTDAPAGVAPAATTGVTAPNAAAPAAAPSVVAPSKPATPPAAAQAVAPPPLAAAKPLAAATPSPTTPKLAAPAAATVAIAPKPVAKPVDFGSVSAPEPAKTQSVPVAQPGLTASPTDFAAAQDKAKSTSSTSGAATSPANAAGATATAGAAPGTGRPTSLGGVTGNDVGGGYMIAEEAKKSRSTVTRDAIDKQAPTANPYQIINLLPGVVQSSTDNAGLNGGNIRIRGFNSDHVGLTIEGAPVNDSGSYTLFPQEYVDAENIAQVSLAQGSPDLDSPHIGATVGVLNIYAVDPSKTAGALVDYSFGSNNLSREFVRIQSGQVGAFRAFLSYSHLDQDHWGDNPGSDKRDHLDFKLVADISPGNTVRVSAIYNSAINNFYPNPTLTQFQTNGAYKFRPTLPANFATTSDQSGFGNYYGYRVNPFKNLILSAPSNFTVTEKLKFDTIPYYWYGYGNGGGAATMQEASGMIWGNMKVTNVNYGIGAGLTDKPLFYNPSITETNRPGIINKFTYTTGDHQIVAGHWFEYAVHSQRGGFTPLNADGTVSDFFGDTNNFVLPASAKCQRYNTVTKKYDLTVTCPAGAMEKRDVTTKTMTNMMFVGDTWKFAPNWSADFGVKQILANRSVEDRMPFAPMATRTLNDEATLPTVGVKYKWNEENQVFASIGTSFRSAANFTLTPNYNTTSTSGFGSPVVPKPETSITYELGHRYQGSQFSTAVTGFVGRYENFQQNTNTYDVNGNPVNSQINVGGLLNYGINAEFGTRPIANFRPYISAELLQTELLDNMPTTYKVGAATFTDNLRTKGKQLVGAPNYSLGFGLDYDNGHLFANAAYKYIGEQYSTYMNDEKMDAYGRLDLGIGYRFNDIDKLKQPEIKLSLFNVLNSRELTGIFSNQTNAKATTGVNGGAIGAAGSPTYYQGQDFSFMVTLRAGL